MEKLNFPILYYQWKKKSLLGILVILNQGAVEKDLKSLKNTFSGYLQGLYKKLDAYPPAEIIQPKLKILKVSIRPVYREKTGSYPLQKLMKVPVPLVYGATKKGYFECFLPTLDEEFYYYEARQLDAMAKHFATNLLNEKNPEELYRLMTHPEPKLDCVTLKVHEKIEVDWNPFLFRSPRSELDQLAEKFPYPKVVQKKMSVFPEAAWEREGKVADVMEKIVNQRANILLVGNHGVGKSAVLRQAIKKITSQLKKQNLPYSFWRIQPQRITARAKYLGEWQDSVELLVEDLETANGVLWVVDIIQLLQTGGAGPEDSVAAFMLSFIQQGKLQLMGEATPQELESMRRLLPGFAESFQLVPLEELREKKIRTILQKFADFSKQNLKIAIEQDALSLAYRLLLRHYPYESFPGKGVKFFGQCVSEAQLNNSKKVDKQDVISHFVKQTGLPELFLRDDILLDKEELQNHFDTRIIGQPNAVEKLCSIVKIYKAGLNNPHKPISTLLFAGPTGVGKTASAKALADYFFGKGQKRAPLVRIDMSEFQHPHQISRFIGFGKETGQLVKEIRERPFAVLLLDEIEKADPSIFDALLTVLDEGMLVDAFGRITNFRNTIIILTTNLGASNRKSIGYKNTSGEETVFLSAISKYFRPEFVNRIDGIVLFNSLRQEDVRAIAKKELNELKKREGLVAKGLQALFTKKVVEHLSTCGFNERYGARPLQRAIEDEIVKPLAAWILKHPDVENCKLTVDFEGKINVTRK